MTWRMTRDAAALLTVALAACSDAVPTTPSATSDIRRASVNLTANSVIDGQQATVSPVLDDMNARLAAAGARVRVSKAELLLDAGQWSARKAVIIIAKDFERGIGAEWVRGDFRRDGRRGVTWAFGSNRSTPPWEFTEDGTAFRPLSAEEQLNEIERGMDGWRDLRCSADPVQFVPVSEGTDPDFLNDLAYTGAPSANYVQPADIVHSGWQPLEFFQVFAGPDAPAVLGVTFTFVFVDENGVKTDVDGNGQEDLALAELYYTDLYAWSKRGQGRPGTLDFLSIIGHEAGHAFGLGHWGLVFVLEKDAQDGITADEIRFRPKALMNAVYVGGENRLEVPDRVNFCAIWASPHARVADQRKR